MDCHVCPPEVHHPMPYLHALPLNPKYAPLFRKTALIKASGLSENEI